MRSPGTRFAALASVGALAALLVAGCSSSPNYQVPLAASIPSGNNHPGKFVTVAEQPARVYRGLIGTDTGKTVLSADATCPTGLSPQKPPHPLGALKISAAFICPDAEGTPAKRHYEQVAANRVQALLQTLATASARAAHERHSVCFGYSRSYVPIVVARSTSGVFNYIALASGPCLTYPASDVVHAINVALAPANVYLVHGAHGFLSGVVNLGRPCHETLPVHNGRVQALQQLPGVTVVYVCEPVLGPTAAQEAAPRYWVTVPDTKTAAFLQAMTVVQPTYPPGTVFHCPMMYFGQFAIVVAVTTDGKYWTVHVPAYPCGFPMDAPAHQLQLVLGRSLGAP